MLFSVPPRLCINRGKRKKEEKLQKKRKLAVIISEKFRN